MKRILFFVMVLWLFSGFALADANHASVTAVTHRAGRHRNIMPTARASTTPGTGTTIPSSGLSARAAHSSLAQPFPRLQSLRRVRIALDQMPQFADAIILLSEFEQRESFFQLR